MKKKFLENTLFIIGIFAFINCYSNDSDYNECEDYKKTFQGHSAPEGQLQKGYNHSARIDVRNSWDYYVGASYIYWQPRQRGLELAKELYLPDGIGIHINFEFIHMDFDYHSGFKVGTGANFERDDWSLDFEYTRLYTTNRKTKTLSKNLDDIVVNYLDTIWESELSIGAGFYAKGRWKLNFNIVDSVLARSFYVGTHLSFKPYIGLRAGWINQKYRVDYSYIEDPDEADSVVFNYSSNKSKSWLLGPRVGVDTNWHLGEGVRLFGNAAASLFYQHFKTNINIITPAQELVPNFIFRMRDKEGFLNPNFEVALGMAWGSYFCDDNWHVDLSAGYEFHIFWDQNMMRRILDAIGEFNLDTNISNLVLHGLTVSLIVDF